MQQKSQTDDPLKWHPLVMHAREPRETRPQWRQSLGGQCYFLWVPQADSKEMTARSEIASKVAKVAKGEVPLVALNAKGVHNQLPFAKALKIKISQLVQEALPDHVSMQNSSARSGAGGRAHLAVRPMPPPTSRL